MAATHGAPGAFLATRLARCWGCGSRNHRGRPDSEEQYLTAPSGGGSAALQPVRWPARGHPPSRWLAGWLAAPPQSVHTATLLLTPTRTTRRTRRPSRPAASRRSRGSSRRPACSRRDLVWQPTLRLPRGDPWRAVALRRQAGGRLVERRRPLRAPHRRPAIRRRKYQVAARQGLHGALHDPGLGHALHRGPDPPHAHRPLDPTWRITTAEIQCHPWFLDGAASAPAAPQSAPPAVVRQVGRFSCQAAEEEEPTAVAAGEGEVVEAIVVPSTSLPLLTGASSEENAHHRLSEPSPLDRNRISSPGRSSAREWDRRCSPPPCAHTSAPLPCSAVSPSSLSPWWSSP